MKVDPLIRAVVSAALARLLEAVRFLRGLALGLAADDSRAGENGERLIMQYAQERALREMRRQSYKTNDIVEVPPFSPAEGLVVINGIGIQLRTDEALLLHALVEHGRTAQDGELRESSFLPVPDIIALIDRMKAQARLFGGSNLTKHKIHRAVHSLREKLLAQLLNPHLIEGKRNQGYRLSTPRWNLVIGKTFPAPALPGSP